MPITLSLTYCIKKTINNDEKNLFNHVDPELDRRMRILANLIIDRVLEDKKNGKLRFNIQN